MIIRQRLLIGLFACILPFSPAKAQDTDLELVFLADSSGSIDTAESAFQRQGHAMAISHPDVLSAINSGLLRKIAITYVEWGDAFHQDVVVPWMIIDGPESAKAFSDALMAAPRRAQGFNAIGSALAKGRDLIENNTIRGTRKVMDLSGDSANNWDGVPIEVARDAAVSDGIVINGLPILCRETNCGGRPVSYDLEKAYEDKIIGGPGAFVVTAKDRESFEMAVRRKLILEIAGHQPAERSRFGFARADLTEERQTLQLSSRMMCNNLSARC
jgi:hypothetical protein